MINKNINKKSTKIMEKRNTKSGGKNTNKNGLSYEYETNLDSEYNIVKKNLYSIEIQFRKNPEKKFLMTSKKKFLKSVEYDSNISKAHGCKQPDEVYIDEMSKIIFILEKKFQQCGGSVCEKIQSVNFKMYHFQKLIPDYKICYIYCLSDWFKHNCKAELEYFDHEKIPYFWGNDKNYKEKIVDFILEYKS